MPNKKRMQCLPKEKRYLTEQEIRAAEIESHQIDDWDWDDIDGDYGPSLLEVPIGGYIRLTKQKGN
jgi:hypothetical protein